MPTPFQSTTFAGLIKKTLKMIDMWNSSDQTRSTPNADSNSSGEIAGIAVNMALHTCYDLVKDSKYLKALPTTSLSSTANQDYIDLDILTNLDEIESIMDTSNNIRLLRKSWNFYRRFYPDPSKVTGNPLIYARRGENRIYLAPRPTSVINYTIDFVKLQNDLVDDGDLPLLPTQYDYWIVAEAMCWWAKMENAMEMPAILVQDRNEAREIAVNAIMSDFDQEVESESHWNENRLYWRDYQRPVG